MMFRILVWLVLGSVCWGQTWTRLDIVQSSVTSQNPVDSTAGLVIDEATGNRVFAGGFFGTINIGGNSITNAARLETGEANGFVSALDTVGKPKWVQQIMGMDGATPNAMTRDTAGNIYIVGRANKAIRIGSLAVTNLVPGDTAWGSFVIKLSKEGVPMQAFKIDLGNIVPTCIAVDHRTNVFVGGYRGVDGIIVKQSPAGSLLWAKTLEAPGSMFYDLKISNDDFVYACGLTSKNAVFLGTPITTEGLSGIVGKISQSGELVWEMHPTGGRSISLALHCSGESVYVGGGAGNGASFGAMKLTLPGDRQIPYLVRMDSQGNVVWGRTLQVEGFGGNVKSITADSRGRVFVSVGLNGPLLVDDTTVFTGFGNNYAALAAFTDLGDFLWVTRAGGRDPNQIGTTIRTVAITPDDRLVAYGTLQGNASFGDQNTNADDRQKLFLAELTQPQLPNVSILVSNSNPIVGDSVILTSQIIGSEPMEFQWTRNGSELQGETNRNLTLRNVTTQDNGVFTLRVRNNFGSAVSLAINVQVQPLPTLDLLRLISWPRTAQTNGFLLQKSSNLEGPWRDDSTIDLQDSLTNYFIIRPVDARTFFRLKRN